MLSHREKLIVLNLVAVLREIGLQSHLFNVAAMQGNLAEMNDSIEKGPILARAAKSLAKQLGIEPHHLRPAIDAHGSDVIIESPQRVKIDWRTGLPIPEPAPMPDPSRN